MLSHIGRAAPPQCHFMAGKREICRRRKRSIAAAKNCDLHSLLLSALFAWGFRKGRWTFIRCHVKFFYKIKPFFAKKRGTLHVF